MTMEAALPFGTSTIPGRYTRRVPGAARRVLACHRHQYL